MPTSERPTVTQGTLPRRRDLSRELARRRESRNIREVARWWNQHVGTKFEEDISAWIVNRFTAIDARSRWANDVGAAIDESEDENAILKALKVARGRHLVSKVVMQKFVYEAKKHARGHNMNEGIAMDYVRDRATSEGGIFDILGVTTEGKQQELLELAA